MAKAAPKNSSDINIDLLKTKEPQSRSGEAVHWLLHVGRYLIILTQIVAIAIFLLSIKLSTDKNNLGDDIQDLSAQVSAQESFENEFRNTSKRFTEVKSLQSAHFENNKVMGEFLNLLPKGMTLTEFKIGGDDLGSDEIEFSGQFDNTRQLQTLVVEFSKSNLIVGLDIKELNHPNEENPDKFTFRARALINQVAFD